MNYKEKVRYLKSYKDLFYRLEYINSQIEKIKSPGHSEEGGGPLKTINDYLDEKAETINKMAKIENLIDEVEDNRCRLVLAYKFLQFKTLEEIAEIISYSYEQTRRYYRKGIKNIKT